MFELIAAYDLIRQKVRTAIARLRDFKPQPVKAPIALEITMKHRLPVEHLAYMKFFERTDAYTIRYVGPRSRTAHGVTWQTIAPPQRLLDEHQDAL